MDQDNGPVSNETKQVQDATMRSTDSNYISITNGPKRNEKIQAYVDFSDFNKNYQEYLKTHAAPISDHGTHSMDYSNISN